ncbi:YihY/virulence factor BrkB family protein [Acidipila rosea]|uniref:Membrane protein n=1 Tax=Acidipila rosea TaxID=768535 RepID=A0A4R1LCL3_9BACT|nr:YihY/virulence factor BrkB family protein [Acidipila rosea]MBW4027064.1 YihY/virulence factor BrkB family protein [Acidobacteriota bacterium]MBW4045132.1 YihY/virulence factor BrkB family protein [Acidobacteriota bacterium]TCK75367.1 membrane protein [Acidipila rosea]
MKIRPEDEYGWKQAIRQLPPIIYNELFRTRAFVIAAAIAFYFLLSLVPLLFIFSSLLGYLPIPNLFQQLLNMMAALVPADAMALVERIVSGVLTTHHQGLLSFGVLTYLWASTGGFSALIDALNVAYDVEVTRPWWRDRLQALLLTFTSGALAVISLIALLSGPRFGHFMVRTFGVPEAFADLWPALRIAVMFVTFVIGLELVYLMGPNRRSRVWSTLPGATFAVVTWFLGSFGLSFYLNHMSNYNATYGSLGAVIGLMLWLYLTGCAIIAGAEVNAELEKQRRGRVAARKLGRAIPGIPAA